ncbi:hypothetical protein Skr01_37400 [Sphaerisporangium krabiense]|uniref:AcrR family transcriptional regulator n=1 Tax=Sphaerisporangium krabiense TaxID=763782 RepID=A0A7W9DPR2_9ACTN|nr:TetR/AcrR family transcriptional regulator [Sphaerisporangium krabiense]MBB5626736.1 AcrR family transcriptional regulator [Sphaerisporangium krabiense]GII63655.1 hypothetical protein Skr01_37400 [Sphaerisporangium krabiense]
MATTQPNPEDLTARARIRDAALLHFGEHGFERATIRGIAKTAGVSSGLVRHHFGSKQALREACDDYMAQTVRQLNDQAREGLRNGTFGDIDHIAAARAALIPYQRYLARELADGSAAALFDQMVEMTEGWLATFEETGDVTFTADRRSRATVLTAMALAVPVLHEHVSRGLGVDTLTPEGDHRLAMALLDIYSHPLMSPEDAAAARVALDKVRDQTPAERDATLRAFKERQP